MKSMSPNIWPLRSSLVAYTSGRGTSCAAWRIPLFVRSGKSRGKQQMLPTLIAVLQEVTHAEPVFKAVRESVPQFCCASGLAPEAARSSQRRSKLLKVPHGSSYLFLLVMHCIIGVAASWSPRHRRRGRPLEQHWFLDGVNALNDLG